MFSSLEHKKDVLLAIYQSNRTIFRLSDIAMLTNESNFQSLNKKMNYYVHTGKLLNPRKGVYAKPDYKPEELACSVFTPSYISLEYILQKAGIIFQFDPSITVVSYLNRNIETDKRIYRYRKIKETILLNTLGIVKQDNVNIASPERAFLDMLYLEKEYFFDNLNSLNREQVYKLLPIYQSKALTKRITDLVPNV